MKIKSLDIQKNKNNNFEVKDEIFGINPRSDIISRVIRWQLSRTRSGNHKVKSRSEIRSTNAKIYRQKGTGRARHGPSSVVQFRGGGAVHGPIVRNHSHKLPKKIRVLGLKSALSLKAKDGNLKILENFNLDKKTKIFKSLLDKENIKNMLLVIGSDEGHENISQSINNIPNMDFIKQIGLNVYDIIKKEQLLFTQQAIKEIQERLL